MAHTTHPNPTSHPAATPSTGTSAASQPQAQQAPAETPLKWAYPFNALKQGDEVTAQTYFTALSQAEDGFFPMGGNGLWHGGIHFGPGTAGTLDQQSGVRAIASGEVVAYRLNEKYPIATYPDKNQAMYSSGFVLIRHRLTMPRAPVAATAPSATSATPTAQSTSAQSNAGTATAAQPTSAASSTQAPPSQPADETLTFFSLYMHLMDWAGYQAADAKQDGASTNDGAKAAQPTIQHMAYWQGSKKYRLIKSKNANNKQEQPPKAALAAADDPLGAFIANDFKEAKPIDPATVYTGEGIAIRRNAPSKGPHAPKSDIIGILPIGAEITISRNADTPDWGYIGEVLKGKIYPPKAGDTLDPAANTGCVYYKEMLPLIVPAPLDQVVVLDKPCRVEAGDVVGYLGEFQRYREAKPIPPTPLRSQVHLEVFAGDEFEAFFQKSKRRAEALPDGEKSVLLISKGAKLVSKKPSDKTLSQAYLLKPVKGSKSSSGWWALVQPTVVTAAPATATSNRHRAHGHPQPVETAYEGPLWVERSLSGATIDVTKPPSAWTDYPLKMSHTGGTAVGYDMGIPRSLLDKHFTSAVDDEGKRWWSVAFANEKGQVDSAWVCESGHPGTQWVSPFAWPGFEIVDHTGVSLVDQFKRFLLLKNEALNGEDLNEFAPAAASVNGSDLIVKLESAIDKQGDGNGKVTAGELQRAMGKPWLARPISRLVVRFESEWGGDMSKWHALDGLLGTGRYVWQTELDRIEKLQFWKDVEAKKVGGFPKTDEVFHFHPVGLIENFSELQQSGCCVVTADFLTKIIGSTDTWFEGRGGTSEFKRTFATKYPNIYHFSPDTFSAMMNDAMDRFGIKTCYQRAHFLSQCFHEAAHFQTTIEFASGHGYDPGVHPDAENNGNTQVGDGPKYKGRGLMQLTWKNNYKKYAAYSGLDVVNNPDLVAEDMRQAIQSACWYWRHNGTYRDLYQAKGDINVLVDNEPNNVTLITKAVNGGSRGLEERKQLFAKVKKEWGLE